MSDDAKSALTDAVTEAIKEYLSVILRGKVGFAEIRHVSRVAAAAEKMLSVLESTQGSDLFSHLLLPISALDLSQRAANCVEQAGIRTIADLCRKSEDGLISLSHFGRVTLKEIQKKLGERGLRIGMRDEVDSVLGYQTSVLGYQT